MSKKSIETFIEQIESGNIASKKHQIYAYLKSRPSTLEHLRSRLPISHQTLTARLSDLMDEGLVWQNADGVFYYASKYSWELYAFRRQEQRKEKWLKVGKKNGWIY